MRVTRRDIPPGYVNTHVAARMLGVSSRTIRNMIYRGEIQAIQYEHRRGKYVHTRYLIPVEEIQRVLAERKKIAVRKGYLPPFAMNPYPRQVDNIALNTGNKNLIRRLMGWD